MAFASMNYTDLHFTPKALRNIVKSTLVRRFYGGIMNTVEQALNYVEEMFRKYGAEPADDASKAELLGLRRSYVRGGIYYRAESADFKEGQIIIITATDNPEYAKVGIQDNIAGFPADFPEEKIEKEVRFAFDIEPYPENYPDY